MHRLYEKRPRELVRLLQPSILTSLPLGFHKPNVRNDRNLFGSKYLLSENFVHGNSGSGKVAADEGNISHPQKTHKAAVFPERAVHCRKHHVYVHCSLSHARPENGESFVEQNLHLLQLCERRLKVLAFK